MLKIIFDIMNFGQKIVFDFVNFYLNLKKAHINIYGNKYIRKGREYKLLQTNTFDILLKNTEASLSDVETREVEWIQSQEKVTYKEVAKAIRNILIARNTFNNFIESIFKTYFSAWESTLKELESYNMDVEEDLKSFKEDKRISREHIQEIRKEHNKRIYNLFKYFCSLYIGERKVCGFKELLMSIFESKTISFSRCEYVLTYLKNYLQNVKQTVSEKEMPIGATA